MGSCHVTICDVSPGSRKVVKGDGQLVTRGTSLSTTWMVKLHEAVKSETGERTVKVTVLMPTGTSPPSCLAQAGFESTYLNQSMFDLGCENVT